MALPPVIPAATAAQDSDDDPDWWRRRLRDPRLMPAMRRCLGPVCWGRRTFHSAHAGDRICPRCRALLHRLYGIGDDPGEGGSR